VKTRQQVDMSYVIRDRAGKVVVIFSGADAPEAAREWAGRGYEVAPTVLDPTPAV
jgi:hypothetical protein